MLNKLKNMSVKRQILMLAAIMCILLIIVGLHGIIASFTINSTYDNMLKTTNLRSELADEMDAASNNCQSEFFYMIVANEFYKDETETNDSYDRLMEKIDKFYALADEYSSNVENDRSINSETREKLTSFYNSVVEDIDEFSEYSYEVLSACLNNNHEEVDTLVTNVTELIYKIDADIQNMVDIAGERSAAAISSAKSTSTISIIVTIIVLIISIIIGSILSLIIASGITKPLRKIKEASSLITNGDFNVDTRTNLKNEIGQISNNFSLLIERFTNIINDMHKASAEINNNGNLDMRIDSSVYPGAYHELANDINKMLDTTSSELSVIIESINEYSNGNFEFTVPRFPGKKAILHEAMDSMKHQLEHISATIIDIIKNINDGNLDLDISTDGFKGDWEVLVNNLEELVGTVARPIKATKNALYQIASANFSYRADPNKYKGEFKEMAIDINKTTSVLSEYIVEISEVLTKMSNQDLDVSINKEYIGDFSIIKNAVELIIKNFNKLIEEIMLSSEQVAIGSHSIADSSTSLAQGASEQASAVEELTATIGSVAENTVKNTELVLESNALAIKAQESVELVKKEMGDLLDSMREINESSNNISAVLQVIDDIAFQTNILALNAAVEAARAGEQGKGFAIVAEEVRNLAARSQEAAKNSSDLIAVSVAKAEQGSMIADRTAETIKTVTAEIEKISEISNSVADSSKEQNKSINEINIGIKQISEVVSTNTATSEESAAASEELASQSAVFKEMVSKFNLKNKRTRR